MVGNAGEHDGEPGAWVDVVQLGGGDEGVDHRGPLAAAVAAREQPGLTAEGNAAEGTFGRVVGQTDPAVIETPSEDGPAL